MLAKYRFGQVLSIANFVVVLTAAGFYAPLNADEATKDSNSEIVAVADSTKAVKEKLSKEVVFSKDYIAKLSESYGHLIYKSLESPVVKLNFDSVIQGMQEARTGKAAPFNDQQYEEAVSLIQEYAFQDMAQNNLKEAEEFLKKNSKEKGVIELTPGKLQYIQETPGKDGAQVVTEDMMPSVMYKGTYANGTVFGSTQESGEAVPIMLQQTIPGFRQAILGMKVGEKRKIFIHPDLGYGTSGQLSPNALLIFDIEVTKVEPAPKNQDNADDDDDDDSLTAMDDSDIADSEGDEGESDDDKHDTDL